MGKALSPENLSRLSKIKMVVFDVDGVLTNAQVFYLPTGEPTRFFSIRDGWGQKRLVEAGYELGIITGSKSFDIQERVQRLKIQHLYEGIENKGPSFKDLLKKTGLRAEEVAYMGDDEPDLPILGQVGFASAPADAHEKVLSAVHFVSQYRGGLGAARELCDLVFYNGAKVHE